MIHSNNFPTDKTGVAVQMPSHSSMTMYYHKRMTAVPLVVKFERYRLYRKF